MSLQTHGDRSRSGSVSLSSRRFWVAPLFSLGLLAMVAGCPSTVTPNPPTDTGGDQNNPGQRTSGEPNDTFSQALDITLDANGSGRIAGSITTTDDVDVYRLDGFAPGDQIIVDVSTNNNGLDADVALFDGGGKLIFENDDRNIDLNQLDPFVNLIVREETSVLYVGIASSPLNPTTGNYDATITVTRGGQVPPTRPQTIALNVTGGSASVSGTVYTVPVFNTADIDSRYAGMTQQVINGIVSTIQQNYSGLQLTVLVTGRDTIPADGVSTILLGGTSPNAYGLAEQIDWYNADHNDDAIIFTDMFKPFRFGRVLTAAELGTAIGNVVSHEVGHLLGLNHVDNIQDLMDTTGSADTFLLDQAFTTSPLDGTIFPIGLQDGLMLLDETLSPAP